jgi:sulfur carrier protein ThiS
VIVKVNLYGTLGQNIPGYRHLQGIVVEIPDGATVKDLLAHLEISESLRAVVIAEGRILNGDDVIMGEVPVNILQAIRGGCQNKYYGLSIVRKGEKVICKYY